MRFAPWEIFLIFVVESVTHILMNGKSVLVTLFALCFFCAAARPQILHCKAPASFFEESLVIGNGKLGASIYRCRVRQPLAKRHYALDRFPRYYPFARRPSQSCPCAHVAVRRSVCRGRRSQQKPSGALLRKLPTSRSGLYPAQMCR